MQVEHRYIEKEIIDQKNSPTISVVIPCYNNSKFICEALESVLRQTRPALEVIVVDDGSTDGSGELVLKYGSDVKLIRQENQGRVGSRKTGMKAASGEWIALLDADDYWAPNKLETQAKFIDASPSDTVIVHSKYSLCGDLNAGQQRCYSYDIPDVVGLDFLFHKNAFATSTILLKRDVLESVIDYWNLGRYRAQDYGLFLLVSAHGKAVLVNETLSFYRVHSDNEHDSYQFILGILKSREALLEYLSKNSLLKLLPNDWKQIMSISSFGVAWELYSQKEYGSASNYFMKSYCYDYTRIVSLAYWFLLFLPSKIVNGVRRILGSESV